MPQSMLNAAQPAGRLFANRSSADSPTARFSLAFRSGSSLPRFSLASGSSLSRLWLVSPSLYARFSLAFHRPSP
ncbi:MAG: hypothetical protein WBX06_20255, partial [Acidobacteriaceae bacterium]